MAETEWGGEGKGYKEGQKEERGEENSRQQTLTSNLPMCQALCGALYLPIKINTLEFHHKHVRLVLLLLLSVLYSGETEAHGGYVPCPRAHSTTVGTGNQAALKSMILMTLLTLDWPVWPTGPFGYLFVLMELSSLLFGPYGFHSLPWHDVILPSTTHWWILLWFPTLFHQMRAQSCALSWIPSLF